MAQLADPPQAPHRLAELSLDDDGEKESAQISIDFSKVNFDDIVLPPGEDFGIRSDEDEEEEEIDEFDSGFGNVIVVDNLPVVAPEKYGKLENVISKIFGQMGTIREHGLVMPIDEETQKTKGFAFIEYNTKEEAQAAREQADNYKLDKAHVFSVKMFDELEKYMKVFDEWVPPEVKPYVPAENMLHWLTDDRGRDQFVIRFGAETEVYWNDARLKKPDLFYHRTFWTESFVQWSPLGTYVATIHRQGAAVWGGATTFNRLMRYIHPQVKLIDFSPGEKFLVTYSSHEPSNPRDTQKVTLNVYDVRTGRVLREFKGGADDYATGGVGGVAGVSWPVFRWAGGRDDKYFARISKNAISVYETETMGLLDKKSLKIDNVTDFSWSPTDSILSLFVPEGNGGNQPARVSLVQIPSREELRQKNLFSVSDCKMYWQSNGEYLAVKVDRYTKTKKSTYTGFELFRIKERDIPIEVLELENKNDKIIAFAWEPKGHRFAIIHGDGPRPDVTFYSMKSPTHVGRVTKLITLKGKQANALFWSPTGRFIVLAGLKAYNGQLEFYNVDDLETMAMGEHFMATDVDWDPTGRYVATSVTSVHQMENGFNMWSFSGKPIYRLPRDRFFQFLWRPRPPSLLSPEKEEEIVKNLKKYSKKYEVEDAESLLSLSAADMENRRRIQDEWKGWIAQWKKLHDEEAPMRMELRDGEASDEEEEYEAEEVEVEEILNIDEEVVSFGFEQLD